VFLGRIYLITSVIEQQALETAKCRALMRCILQGLPANLRLAGKQLGCRTSPMFFAVLFRGKYDQSQRKDGWVLAPETQTRPTELLTKKYHLAYHGSGIFQRK
jgi:hypothetical protein